MIEVDLPERRDDKAEIKDKIDPLCQYLACNLHDRQVWALFIDEFRDYDDFLDNAKTSPEFAELENQEYVNIFIDAFNQNKEDLRYLIGGVPERFVFHTLNIHSDSAGKAKKEVYVKINKDGEFWSSKRKSSKRKTRKTLDVAFWDNDIEKGRGFECKIAHISDSETRSAILELLSTINTFTEGAFETVIFSFCLNSRSFYETLIRQKELSEEERNQLSNIRFIGFEHLPFFDGTTSCCGNSSLIPIN